MTGSKSPSSVLSIDPGRDKCGVAVVCRQKGVLWSGVVRCAEIGGHGERLVQRFGVETMIVGAGTGTRRVQAYLTRCILNLPLVVVDERETTLEARGRYFSDHPPLGWRRLLPLSLQIPPEPYDHYVAILLAERFFNSTLGDCSQAKYPQMDE